MSSAADVFETLLRPQPATLAAVLLVIVASLWLGAAAQRAIRKQSFLTGFFLGGRGLGPWALALTATVQSGGTFMGFPSLAYSHGWVLLVWIASYMVVPITGFAVLGKRLAHLSRRTGAITAPDLFRERFSSPALGLATSLLVMMFLFFMMVAQFKAGALVMKFAWAGPQASAAGAEQDALYYVGLTLFATTVVAYTAIGGFLASVWTDLFQSVLMFVGVVILCVLALAASGGLEAATRTAVARTGPGFVFGPGYGADGAAFLPLGTAISFYFVWIFGGLGAPTGMVRLMATRDAPTLRRSIVLLSFYNLGIYPPLVAICVAARAQLGDLARPDEVVPRMAQWATGESLGGQLLCGLILAAPFGAVMSTVSSILVVIASGVVRDIYQRFVHRTANDREIRLLTTATMLVVGGAAVVANLWPVKYLQTVVVFASSGQAAALVAPALMACYWRRATVAGVVSAMAAGSLTVMALFVLGLRQHGYEAFRPYALGGLEPSVWGLAASAMAGVAVSLFTAPPPPEVVSALFDQPREADR